MSTVSSVPPSDDVRQQFSSHFNTQLAKELDLVDLNSLDSVALRDKATERLRAEEISQSKNFDTMFHTYVNCFSSIMTTHQTISALQREDISGLSRLDQIVLYEHLNENLGKAFVGRNGTLCGVLKKVSKVVSERLSADESYGSSCLVFSSQFVEKATRCLLCTPATMDEQLFSDKMRIWMPNIPRLPDFAREQMGHAGEIDSQFPVGGVDTDYLLLHLTNQLGSGNDSLVKRFCDTLLGNNKNGIPSNDVALDNLAAAVEYLRRKLTIVGA